MANVDFYYGGYGYTAVVHKPIETNIEDFENYSAGQPLSGQGDWGGGSPNPSILVATSTVHRGYNSVWLNGNNGNQSYRVLSQPLTAGGTLSFWVYYSAMGNQGVSITDVPNDNPVVTIYYDSNKNCYTSDGSCFRLNGGLTTIQTVVGGWHQIEVQINFANHLARMRQDGGEWSDWQPDARGVNIGRIRFDRAQGEVFYDDFVYSQPSNIPDYPALSIDSGATVVVQ